ncbi:ArsR/SmtB family transcription factor [Streptomyces sp. NPDC058603]|uniref:ArsR/SmtB family transcription factor n=1 Tax=unclassified Streptomyces TaxID=2593676 RepID=UPI003663F972
MPEPKEPEEHLETEEPVEPVEPAESRPQQRPWPTNPKQRTLDARSLRGLAHPLRMRLLSTLRHDGPGTASQLAEQLGESSGATSYHLRQLAAHGFVEDDPTRGKGRERWWRATDEGTTFSPDLHTDSNPAVRGAVDLFLHEVATIHTQELATWLGTASDWPREWSNSADLSDFTLRLTAEQLHEMNEKLHEVVERYRSAGPGDGEAPQVRIHLHSFPRTGSTDRS